MKGLGKARGPERSLCKPVKENSVFPWSSQDVGGASKDRRAESFKSFDIRLSDELLDLKTVFQGFISAWSSILSLCPYSSILKW